LPGVASIKGGNPVVVMIVPAASDTGVIVLSPMGVGGVGNSDLLIKSLHCVCTMGFEASFCTIEFEDTSTDYCPGIPILGGSGIMPGSKAKGLKIDAYVEVRVGFFDNSIIGSYGDTETIYSGIIVSIVRTVDDFRRMTYKITLSDVKVSLMAQHSMCLSDDFLGMIKKTLDFTTPTSPLAGKALALEIGSNAPKFSKIQLVRGTCSDYDFIVSSAQMIGWSFYVYWGKVYFSPPEEYASSISLELEGFPFPNLIGLELEERSLNIPKKVTFQGIDPDAPETVLTGTGTAETAVGDGSVFSVKTALEKVIVHPLLMSTSEAETMGKACALKESLKYINGKLTIQGCNTVVLGKSLKIKDVSPAIDGKYLIKGIEHIVNPIEGWITIIYFSGNVPAK